MVMERRGSDTGKALVVGGLGTAVGLSIAALLARRPPDLAPIEEKLDYLIELEEALVQIEGQEVTLLEKILAKEIEVALSVLTPWVAKEPEKIFEQDIRAIGTFYSQKMVDFRNAKRIVFKVDSTLDENVNVQVIGNIYNDKDRATDLNGIWPCLANCSISIGPAWGDWHPYVGIKIITTVAPEKGTLQVWAVIQE